MPPVSKSDTTKYDIDRVPFYGNKLPTNVAALKTTLPRVGRPTFQKIIRVAVSSIEGKPVHHDMLQNLITPEVSLEVIHRVYAGVLKLLQCAFRCSVTSLNQEQFLTDLNTLNIAKEMKDDLVSAVFGSRRLVLENAAIQQKPRLPSITNFKWKIDVGISTTSLNRVLEPVVAVEITLSNGEIKQFEMTVTKFQELRYNAAFVLKEMEDIEKKSVLKIQD